MSKETIDKPSTIINLRLNEAEYIIPKTKAKCV